MDLLVSFSSPLHAVVNVLTCAFWTVVALVGWQRRRGGRLSTGASLIALVGSGSIDGIFIPVGAGWLTGGPTRMIDATAALASHRPPIEVHRA